VSIAIWTLCLILNNNAFLPLDAFSSRAPESLCAVSSLPPSFRFPPLREGNQTDSVPLAYTDCLARVCGYPPPSGSPRFARGTNEWRGTPCFARGTEPRAYAVPPACRGNLKEGVTINTNCAAKVHKCAGFESPLTPTLSPLDKGGEGREWGDSARAGICELWLSDWYKTYLDEPEIPPATGSLWDDRAGSLYDDFKARRVGDLVTIVVVESTTASARANTAVQKSESASTTAGVGPLLNFLWPELGASGKTDSNTQGNTARAGTLQTRITVQVVETYPNGVLRIEGRRTLKINEETQTLVFSGLVRIRDIRADNTVPSTAIANAEIYFEGKGIVGSRQREGILTRLFKIIF
jgi:flagellar L-ring protein precursor FlgH